MTGKKVVFVKCSICGKAFETEKTPADEFIEKWFCSETCMRRFGF